MPITGTVHQQRRTTSRLKDCEENFAKRGTHFLEGHAVRESDVMSVGDVEAIHRFDRVPVVSRLRQGFWQRVIDSWMPGFIEGLYENQWQSGNSRKEDEDYRRSVYPANGVLHIIDPELGVIKIDQYGDVM